MSDTQPTPADAGSPRTPAPDGRGAAEPGQTMPDTRSNTGPNTGPDTGPSTGPATSKREKATKGSGQDPLRGSRTSGIWLAVVASGLILVLLIIFIAQNTDPASIRFLGWEGETPLAVALLIATVAGLFLAAVAGSLRILQLRRRVRRDLS